MKSLEEQLLQSSLYLERFDSESYKNISINLEKAKKEILELIASTQNKATIKKELNRIMQEVFYNIPDTLQKDMFEISEISYDSTTAIMKSFVSAELASNALRLADVEKSIVDKLSNPNTLIQGHTMSDHLSHLERVSARKLQGIILQGFDKGQGIDEINRNARNVIDGLNRNTSNTLIRTSLLEASDNARNESFKYFEDEIIGFRYSSRMDGRTTPYCINAHNYVTKTLKDSKYKTKTHYQCRSLWIPITDISEDFEEDETIVEWKKSRPTPKIAKNGKYKIGNSKAIFDTPKEALDYHSNKYGGISTKFKVDKVKKIPKNLSGEEAFEYFDEDYKKEYLGVARYDMYKSGKATLKDMLDISRNRLVSVDKLKKKLNL